MVQIVHFIFFFIFNITNFEILDSFDATPFYDFRVSGSDCGTDELMVFCVWPGIKIQTIEDDIISIEVVGRSHITKLNGNYFCYKKKQSYKELLFNDQIIKKMKVVKKDIKIVV